MRQTQRSTPSDWFGHPRGLTILFLTEMWEKFSFFGMRAMLVYYMTKQLSIRQSNASLIYGLYTASVFLTPLLGAYLSDRWLGRRRAVVIGGVILAAGHFMMASEPLFYAALATIAAGSGLLLPNLPSQIQDIYAVDDPRRASAFSVYYVGINTGGVIAPLVCGTIGELYGWHWGFTVAGLGMMAGLAIYLLGSRYLPPGLPAARCRTRTQVARTGDHRNRFRLLLGIAAVVTALRASYEQVGNTIAVWMQTGVDRSVAHSLIPMTWFQSLNPLLVFILTPLLVVYWARRAGQGREMSPMTKMACGGSLICLAYLLLAGLSAWVGEARLWWPWAVLFFVLITAGELFVFPVGLDLFARLAPVGFTATAIATWYLAGFAGNLLAGVVGSFWSTLSHQQFFGFVALVAIASTLTFLAFDRTVERESRSRRSPESDEPAPLGRTA